MSKRLHQRLNELSMSLATFDDDGELSFGEDSHLAIKALTELKILWQENRRLRRLITEWADNADQWNRAMWTKDLSEDQRSAISKSALESIRNLRSEVGR